MELHQIKLLGIAPYEGMKTMMQKLASSHPEIILDVYIGDLEQGVRIARSNLDSSYDAIISRGGTAELIGKSTDIPVIEISLSVYDILRSIKLAENYADLYAIVGFPSITSCAHLLCDLLQYKIDVYTIHDGQEAQSTLKALKQQGYRMIICDMITNTTAKKLGLNSILITSGTESIESAFDQAVRICTGYSALREQSRFLKDIIQNSSCHTVIFDGSGDLWYSSFSGEDGGEITEMLRSEIGETQLENSRKFFKTVGGTLYSVEARLIPYSEKQYAAFFLNGTRVPMASGKYGILFSSRKETENQLYNSFYNLSGAMSEVRDEVEKLTQSGFPVMISGEDGTGKEQIARSIYVQSPLKKNPLVTVDCTLINDKSWGYLTNHYHSPFNDNHNTIYFKNIDDLSEERRKQLLSLIVDLNLCERNRLIFSSICGRGEFLTRQCLDFVKILTCVTMRLPALREKPGEIPALASLYLGILNVNLARQIIGFEPDAVTMLQNYDWPYNHSQFKRCLNELAVRTTTPYISCRDVQDFLDKEAKIPYYGAVGTTASSPSFNLNRPLNEIEKDIIRTVLEEAGGNQSSAAKRLGISRTTLWRYLK